VKSSTSFGDMPSVRRTQVSNRETFGTLVSWNRCRFEGSGHLKISLVPSSKIFDILEEQVGYTNRASASK
jgi:hypothetical protein